MNMERKHDLKLKPKQLMVTYTHHIKAVHFLNNPFVLEILGYFFCCWTMVQDQTFSALRMSGQKVKSCKENHVSPKREN